jgi:2-(1,2-epoxy-1,2-dihydrophenyl)acetyl-CoA isomerase
MATPRYKNLLLEKRGPVLWIVFNRPQVMNAFHIEKARELLQAVRFGLRSKDVAVIVLSGKGDVFSAGGDIKLMSGMKDHRGFFLEISRLIHIIVRDMRRSEKPILAAIPGYVGGIAFGFVLATDLRIASEKAKFNAATIKLGLVANGGATYHLPRIVGLAKATEILLLGEVLSAKDALRIGLVNRVVASADLEKSTQEMAEQLAQAPRRALGRLKKLLNFSLATPLTTQLERERQAIAWSATLPDFREGVKAFLEKRKALFNTF